MATSTVPLIITKHHWHRRAPRSSYMRSPNNGARGVRTASRDGILGRLWNIIGAIECMYQLREPHASWIHLNFSHTTSQCQRLCRMTSSYERPKNWFMRYSTHTRQPHTHWTAPQQINNSMQSKTESCKSKSISQSRSWTDFRIELSKVNQSEFNDQFKSIGIKF